MARDVLRSVAGDRAWYVATGLFLPPISFDPVPRIVSELDLPTIGVMYDVIPLRHPDLYLTDEVSSRQVRLRSVLARTVDVVGDLAVLGRHRDRGAGSPPDSVRRHWVRREPHVPPARPSAGRIDRTGSWR